VPRTKTIVANSASAKTPAAAMFSIGKSKYNAPNAQTAELSATSHAIVQLAPRITRKSNGERCALAYIMWWRGFDEILTQVFALPSCTKANKGCGGMRLLGMWSCAALTCQRAPCVV
jgi:hypothetical protein